MGAWGALCVFDYRRFRDVVVPALRAGESHPIVAAEGAFVGLADAMAQFDAELTVGPWYLPGREALVHLVERVITRHCVTAVANFGLRYHRVARLLLLDDEDEDEGPELSDDARVLVQFLDERGGYWTHGSGGYGEGIHGWLDEDETAMLSFGLPRAGNEVIDRFARVTRVAVDEGKGLLWGADLRLLYERDWRRWDGTAPTQL